MNIRTSSAYEAYFMVNIANVLIISSCGEQNGARREEHGVFSELARYSYILYSYINLLA